MGARGCGLFSLLATLVLFWNVYKRGGRQDIDVAGVTAAVLPRRHGGGIPLETVQTSWSMR